MEVPMLWKLQVKVQYSCMCIWKGLLVMIYPFFQPQIAIAGRDNLAKEESCIYSEMQQIPKVGPSKYTWTKISCFTSVQSSETWIYPRIPGTTNLCLGTMYLLHPLNTRQGIPQI